MDCCCNTYNDAPRQFLDIEGIRYFASIMGKYIDDNDKNVLSTAKAYSDEVRAYVDEVKAYTETVKTYAETITADAIKTANAYTEEYTKTYGDATFLKKDAIALEDNVLTFTLSDGSTAEIDLNNISSGTNITEDMIATNKDIDDMF